MTICLHFFVKPQEFTTEHCDFTKKSRLSAFIHSKNSKSVNWQCTYVGLTIWAWTHLNFWHYGAPVKSCRIMREIDRRGNISDNILPLIEDWVWTQSPYPYQCNVMKSGVTNYFVLLFCDLWIYIRGVLKYQSWIALKIGSDN